MDEDTFHELNERSKDLAENIEGIKDALWKIVEAQTQDNRLHYVHLVLMTDKESVDKMLVELGGPSGPS